ncbi:hypothetical protein Entas_3208 [Enterobacter soli]|nr:hypothetical protein Entas_3208 [Enterobacter soli]
MVIPGANGRINKAAKEKEKTDKQYDAGHPSVKSMSFVHTRGLTHCVYPGHTLLGDTDIKAQREEGVNSGMCKKPSMFTLTNVIKHGSCIYCFDKIKKISAEFRKKALFE